MRRTLLSVVCTCALLLLLLPALASGTEKIVVEAEGMAAIANGDVARAREKRGVTSTETRSKRESAHGFRVSPR